MKDLFSHSSDSYSKFRPHYPSDLYDFLLSVTSSHELAWDAGTGNGQVAAELAERFKKVVATDISQSQISRAPQIRNVTYEICASEQSTLSGNTADLITVAQAIHWFDISAFQEEVKRVLKRNGILAYWGYGLGRLSDVRWNQYFRDFYYELSMPYWEPEREHLDTEYRNIHFSALKTYRKDFSIIQRWSSERFKSYLETWSVMKALHERYGIDVVDNFFNLPPSEFIVQFPVFLYWATDH